MNEIFDPQDTPNVQKHITEWHQGEIANTLRDNQEVIDCTNISHIFQKLFGTEYLGNYCCYTSEAQQCSDCSDLYTIIKYHDKNVIVKIGAGEFNTKVFTTGNIKELKWFYHSPIPLFVVDQWHSNLWSEKVIAQKIQDPKKYLDAYAVIVSPKWWTAYVRSEQQRHEQKIDYTPIHIHNHNQVIVLWRNALLQKTFPLNEFDMAVKQIKKLKALDFESFYNQIRKGRKFMSEERQKLIWCLRDMGISEIGSWVWDRQAFQWLYDLIQTFNIQKKKFIQLGKPATF